MIAGATLVGVLVVIAVVGLDRVSGQSVSPKLDFDESQETENTSSTVRPTAGTDASGHGARDVGKGKTGPKIHGVRVTVDTGDNQRGSKESKESVEITESKNKKRVGIHTDITFEISSDNDDSNVTSSGQKRDKEENDASVPIFKGRKSTTTSRPRKPYDPRMPWNPNQPNHSGERRRAGDTPYRPHYPHNVPVYPAVSDRHGGGDEVYRGIDSWSNFVPITSTWTTERSYYEPYQPNSVGGYRAPSWKPCYCVSSSSSSEGRRRRDSTSRPTSSVIHVLDRLDSPFSSGRK